LRREIIKKLSRQIDFTRKFYVSDFKKKKKSNWWNPFVKNTCSRLLRSIIVQVETSTRTLIDRIFYELVIMDPLTCKVTSLHQFQWPGLLQNSKEFSLNKFEKENCLKESPSLKNTSIAIVWSLVFSQINYGS